MDSIDTFYGRLKEDAESATTKSKLSLTKRRSRQFVKDISKNKFASKDMIRKAISKNKKIEIIIKKRNKQIK